MRTVFDLLHPIMEMTYENILQVCISSRYRWSIVVPHVPLTCETLLYNSEL